MFQDDISIKRLETFHPDFRSWIKEHYLIANNKLLPKGYRLRITAVHRTDKEQNDLYSKGRTTKGQKVTNAKAGESIHNYGLAFDIVILRDLDNNGTFESVSWDIDKYWLRVAEFFKSKGFVWGGDWKSFKDYPHFELSKGRTWRDFKAMKTYKNNGLTYPILPNDY